MQNSKYQVFSLYFKHDEKQKSTDNEIKGKQEELGKKKKKMISLNLMKWITICDIEWSNNLKQSQGISLSLAKC